MCLDCDAPLDAGGLKYPGCSMVNAAGLSACSFCGGDFGTAVAEQITAQHLGLELKDGSVEVLFPGGTLYPTEWHQVDTLAVRDDTSGSVRFNVWEGPHLRSAQRNEFCGGFVHERTDGHRGDVPLTLQVRLDADRTVDLRHRVGSGDWHHDRLRRTMVSSAIGRKAEELQAGYRDFLSKWRPEGRRSCSSMPSHRSTTAWMPRAVSRCGTPRRNPGDPRLSPPLPHADRGPGGRGG
ncbi:hypothetical protein ACFUN7_14595 [Streptomyces sp. NPDC057236]|uniref:hypothetical protein n=1 Tax=Streptomyces sp. NPDC057236 TaxID=3346059 RepID=UPI003624F95E